ncbi:dynein heavy chain, N-terminal region 1-domain-containing protein [Mycena floridula]|nr:dynein heavy chain, N-terminal region 1-domain-containing protein [Mycena floridula]
MDPSSPLVATNGSNDDTIASVDAPAEPATPFPPEIFRSYLQAVLPAVLGALPDEILALLADEDFDDKVSKFVGEGGVIYVVKIVEGEEEPTAQYTLTPTLHYTASNSTTLALIKRHPTLDPLIPLASQLHFLNLFGGEETPYESLHAVVSCGVKPWFEAFVGTRKDGGGEAKMGIPMTKKKFAELELSLLHLQQNVEIPETHLVIHPAIQRAVESARSTNTRANISMLPPKLLNDSAFLNMLHGHVNSWIKAIQGVTKLTRDVTSGTASQEINFWLSLERALEGIEAQLRSEEVGMVMDVLRIAKRFRATVSFIADTGLKDATDLVHKYNQLMKDLPLNDLLSATDLDRVHESLGAIFGHINRKLKLSPYPIRRALPLVEAISRDFNDVLLRILTSFRLAYTPYETFDRLLVQASTIFRSWDDLIKEFTNVAREVQRKRSERFIPIKIVPAHGKLQERVRYLREWRKQHEQLAVMTGPSKGLNLGSGTGVGMEEEVKEAYEVVKRVDVLDVSVEGTEIWVAAENAYNERVSRVENQIISRLRDRLGTARNANEMFRVFSKFNALFVRPKIRGAIQEYQTQLIDSVKEDIKHLHDKFKTQYRYSESYHMSQMRDLPPIAGAIIWARQIERQLLTYMKRVEDVLGKGWELYAEGQRLQGESTAFRKKLDTRPVFDAWLFDINRRNMGVEGRLFEVVRLRSQASSSSAQFHLAVNFDPQVITLFKEVRIMLWLGFAVPHAIVNMAKDAKRVYPHAVSLMESVRTYGQILEMVERNKDIEPLVGEWRSEAQAMVTRGMSIRWDHFVNQYDTRQYHANSEGRDNRHVQFVREFASVVSVLQDKTNTVIDLYKDMLRNVEDLGTCPYTPEAFSELLGRVQSAIDRLNLEGYANLEMWVSELDRRIEGVLLARLEAIIRVWCAAFEDDEDKETHHKDTKGRSRFKAKDKDKHVMSLEPLIHEIRIQNQVIFLDPPVEQARATWVRTLHDWLGVICRLQRIQSSRYELGLHIQKDTNPTYTSLLTQLPLPTLHRPFELIESKIHQLEDYVAKWLQFQSLWDLESEMVFSRLGEDLALWQQLLGEIKRARQTFDTSDTRKGFGVAVVEYEQVQSRVYAKYDAWQRDILGRFGGILGAVMKEMHANILKARNGLEEKTIEGLGSRARV